MPARKGRVRLKRECYSLGCWKGQTKEAPGIGRGRPTEILWIIAANYGDLGESVRHPRRLVPLPPVWHRREVRRIGLNQETIPRHQPKEIVVRPLLERHDPAERHIPPCFDREFRQRMRACVAMQDSRNSGTACLTDDRSRIVLGVTSVDDYRAVRFTSERDLRRESRPLRVARRAVVVIVEAALTHRDRAVPKKRAELRDITLGVEGRGVVRVDARRCENEARVFRGALSGDRGGDD